MSGEFTSFWFSEFDGVDPTPHGLRHIFPGRWVRFHSLPGSKRYPDSGAELEVVIERNQAVLSAALSAPPTVLVHGGYVTGSWDGKVDIPGAGNTRRWVDAPVPDEGPDDEFAVFISSYEFTASTSRALLSLIAEDKLPSLFLAAPPTGALVKPYGGGVDVIAKDRRHRDRLAERFRDWMSTHPDGL